MSLRKWALSEGTSPLRRLLRRYYIGRTRTRLYKLLGYTTEGVTVIHILILLGAMALGNLVVWWLA